MTVLWSVTYDDGDYYCCGNHSLGVFSTKERAQAALDTHKAGLTHYTKEPREKWYTYWGPFEVELDVSFED